MLNDVRSAILRRIRFANGRVAPLSAAQAAWEQIPRNYLQTSQASPAETLALFERRLLDYGAEVLHCRRGDVVSAVERILKERAIERLLTPADFPAEFIPSVIEVGFDTGLSAAQLDTFGAVITQCSLAIAETGTLALQTGHGQGRRATSLVPDVHICLVRTQDVVAMVPEAWVHLAPTATLPLTLVSGPSATADIEMTRIQGVHGPRFLHVLLLTNEPQE